MDGSGSRRDRILAAALDCFVEAGYGGAGISDIQKRSGASVGSIYHFFGGKDGIAVALFSEGLRSWSRASLTFPPDASAESIVRASVSGAVTWALENLKLYRFMEGTRFLAPILAAEQETSAIVMEARSIGEAMMLRLAGTGAVKALPWDVMHALILGPAYDWLRLYAHGFADTDAATAISHLSDAAWNAVKAN